MTEKSRIASRRMLLPAHDEGRPTYRARSDRERPRTETTITPACLTVEGNRITEVFELEDYDDALARMSDGPDAPSVYDLGEHLVTPAFINAHTHLAMNAFRGVSLEAATRTNVVEDLFFTLESHLDAGDVRAFARMGAYESLLGGVGLVWDHYYHGVALADALEDTGLCGVVAPTLQDLAGPGAAGLEEALAATESLEARRRADPGRGVWAALGPHATDTVSEELWRRILAQAEARSLPVHVHVAQSIEEYRRSFERHGCSPLAFLERVGALEVPEHLLLVHCLYASRDDLARLDPERHTLCFCPYSQLVFGFPARILAWHDAGMAWFVATDCAASNDSMNVQKELRFVAGNRTMAASWSAELDEFLDASTPASAERVEEVRHGSLERYETLAETDSLLRRVWDIPGRMHPDFEAGRLAVGALANLVVWDTEHPSMWPGLDPQRTLAMGDTTPAISRMMCAGEWIGDGGDFHRSIVEADDYRDARREAQRRLELLLDKI